MPERYRRVLGYAELGEDLKVKYIPYSNEGPRTYLSREVLECGHTAVMPNWNGRFNPAAHRECKKCLLKQPSDVGEGELKLVAAGFAPSR